MDDPGDDRVVLDVVAVWTPDHPTALGPVRFVPEGSVHAGHIEETGDGYGQLALAVQRANCRRQRFFLNVNLRGRHGVAAGGFVWALHKLGPGVWKLVPSVHIPDQIHAFVTLIKVPDPAPWEPATATSGGA